MNFNLHHFYRRPSRLTYLVVLGMGIASAFVHTFREGDAAMGIWMGAALYILHEAVTVGWRIMDEQGIESDEEE